MCYLRHHIAFVCRWMLHVIFLSSLYFICCGLHGWMSTTLSYRFYVPTDKSILNVGVYRISCLRRLMVKPVFLQVITSCNL